MTIAQLEMPVGQNLASEQAQLNLVVNELFLQRKIKDCDGQPFAYEEFVFFFDKDSPRQGDVIYLRYVALANGGIKPEGEMYPEFAPSALLAIKSYVTSLDKFLGSCRNVRWRHRPEIECHESSQWTVYSRLVCYT